MALQSDKHLVAYLWKRLVVGLTGDPENVQLREVKLPSCQGSEHQRRYTDQNTSLQF